MLTHGGSVLTPKYEILKRHDVVLVTPVRFIVSSGRKPDVRRRRANHVGLLPRTGGFARLADKGALWIDLQPGSRNTWDEHTRLLRRSGLGSSALERRRGGGPQRLSSVRRRRGLVHLRLYVVAIESTGDVGDRRNAGGRG